MELGHLLTRSCLTCPEAFSKVCHDSFCQLGKSVSLSFIKLIKSVIAFFLYCQWAVIEIWSGGGLGPYWIIWGSFWYRRNLQRWIHYGRQHFDTVNNVICVCQSGMRSRSVQLCRDVTVVCLHLVQFPGGKWGWHMQLTTLFAVAWSQNAKGLDSCVIREGFAVWKNRCSCRVCSVDMRNVNAQC